MTNILRIPANSQGYLTAIRDNAVDKFDVVDFTYNYLNSDFPEAWAYWKLEEASGTRVDSSGNDRHLAPAGANLPDSSTGVLGNQAHFTGNASSQNRLELAECWDPSGDKQFTYSFWVKSPEVPLTSYASFIITSNLSVTIQGAYGDYGEEGLIVTVNTEDPWNLWISGDPDVYLLPPGVSAHFFIVYDGVGLYVYVDNVLAMSASGSHGMTANMDVVKFGMPAHSSVESWVDEFGIWEVALTAEQRAQLYNSGAGWSPY